MDERKIVLFILFIIVYSLYSVRLWFSKDTDEDTKTAQENYQVISGLNNNPIIEENSIIEQATSELSDVEIITNSAPKTIRVHKTKRIPFHVKDSCSVLNIFTERLPAPRKRKPREDMEAGTNAMTAFGIIVFLIVLIINAFLDILKAKEEERERKKLNPTGERRQSLSEFANKKAMRRQSSKFSLQLFQIAENFVSEGDQKPKIPYNRGDSTNSYLSEKKMPKENSGPATVAEICVGEKTLTKRQSVAKLIGARPAPMVRRSSFPALPLNPDIRSAMLGHRQMSVDSDEEDGKGRRVRLIRRF